MDAPYQDDFQSGYSGDYYVADPMMDQNYSAEPESSGTSSLVWVIIVVVVIIVIVGIILLIWWATRTSDNGTDTGPLAITGSNFRVLSSTSIGATWTRVGSDKDIVTMYVNPSGEEMKFDSTGQPLGSYSTSGSVASPGTTATVTNLTPNASYDAVLIVTNPDVTGFNGSHHESGITTSTTLPPGAKFNITAAAQSGHIHYDINTPPTASTVSYSLANATTNDSLFMRDSDGYICATTLSEPLTPDSKCADGSSVLYASTSTGTSDLSIALKSSLATAELNNARWSYNANGDNKWCLTDPGSTSRCMLYSVNSPILLTPATTTTTSVTAAVNPLVEDISTDQPIFVTTGGSKWTNTQVSTN